MKLFVLTDTSPTSATVCEENCLHLGLWMFTDNSTVNTATLRVLRFYRKQAYRTATRCQQWVSLGYLYCCYGWVWLWNYLYPNSQHVSATMKRHCQSVYTQYVTVIDFWTSAQTLVIWPICTDCTSLKYQREIHLHLQLWYCWLCLAGLATFTHMRF